MKEIVKNRKIKHLIHFTRIENLKSILSDGIKTRENLEESGKGIIFNDTDRADNCTNAICCSICHPNYKMFYSLRQRDSNKEWVVIAIKKDIIWKKDCAFCV
jgi:hypothetical protein